MPVSLPAEQPSRTRPPPPGARPAYRECVALRSSAGRLEAASRSAKDIRRQSLPVGLHLQHVRERVRNILAGEGPLPRQHFVEHRPKRPESARLSTGGPLPAPAIMYAAVPRIMPAYVIAGVVIVGDCDTLGDEPAAGSIAFANPKSSTFTVPSGADFDVGGLQVAMNDALLVCGFKRFGNLLRDRQCVVEGNGSAPDALRQILALDQFHHQGGTPPDSSRP